MGSFSLMFKRSITRTFPSIYRPIFCNANRSYVMKYTTDHEWVDINNGSATIGITNYAQQQLGEIVYVELPEAGTALESGQAFGEVERVKSSSELLSPVGGTIESVNERIKETPSLINKSPESDGWIVKLTGVTDNDDSLMDKSAYEEYLKTV